MAVAITFTIEDKTRHELSADQDAISLFELATQVWVIVKNDRLTWEEKYDLVFSDKISQKVWDLPFTLDDYVDYDTTYEEDVMQFANALFRTANRLEDW